MCVLDGCPIGALKLCSSYSFWCQPLEVEQLQGKIFFFPEISPKHKLIFREKILGEKQIFSKKLTFFSLKNKANPPRKNKSEFSQTKLDFVFIISMPIANNTTSKENVGHCCPISAHFLTLTTQAAFLNPKTANSPTLENMKVLHRT